MLDLQLDVLNLSPWWIALIVVGISLVVLALIFAGVYISIRNQLMRLKNIVEEGKSTIDVRLKKRYDLIPNLVETVKGYAKHESDTLEAVISARNHAMQTTGDGRANAEEALTGTLKSLVALKESYPELKANTNFMDLQQQLKTVEGEIASSRNYYNGTVREFNTKLDVFPSNIVARHLRMEKFKYFETMQAEEREPVKVTF